VIGFSYEKNASGSGGADTAWVDDVKVKAGGSWLASLSFDDRQLSVPAEWERGGTGGGFQITAHDAHRSLRRPAAGAFTGYREGGVRSASQRTLTWPSGAGRNTLSVVYFVDSELDHDYFRVWIDGVEAFAVSGPQRSDTVELDVGASGPHTVRFEYAKDESVDEGLDDARVLHFEARHNEQAFLADDFAGHAVGSSLAGWTTPPGAVAGFLIGAGFEARLYTILSDGAPTVDALVESTYRTSTKATVMQPGITTEPNGRVDFLVSTAGPALFVLLRLPARTPGIGGEQGRVTLYVDADHLQTQRGLDCAGSGALPGSEDRRIVLDYSWSGGAASVTSAQEIGACDASEPWETGPASGDWTVSLAADETASDPGFVHLELRVPLPIAGLLEQGMFGFGLRAQVKPDVMQTFPAFDANPLREDDTSSWASLRVEPAPTNFAAPLYTIIEGTPRR
jgi:hypothetical protein